MITDNKTYYYKAIPQTDGHPIYYGKEAWVKRRTKNQKVNYSIMREVINTSKMRRNLEGNKNAE